LPLLYSWWGQASSLCWLMLIISICNVHYYVLWNMMLYVYGGKFI
jgi:hypothetical protein